MKHRSFKTLILTSRLTRETVSGGQFKWGTCLLKSNGGVYQGQLTKDGNLGGRVKAQAGLTARGITRAERKLELSEPTVVRRTAEDHQPKVTPGITG